MCRVAFVVLVVAICFGQQLQTAPDFSEFPVKLTFHGRAATPKLATRGQRMFRTMILSGGEERDHLRFAGHYTIPQWGCGSDCSQFAVVDSITGQVYGPFTVSGMPGNWLEDHDISGLEHVEFRADSRLIRVNGCPKERNCGFYDYLVTKDKGLKLIHKELLSPEYQP